MGKEGNGRGGFAPSFLILIVLGLGGFAAEIFAQAPQVDSFNPGYARQVWSIALQPDGKVLVGGWFNIGGQTSLARLNRDGTLDSSFNPVVAGQGIPETTVYSIAVQPDGKIVIGGGFASVNGQSRTNIGRLNSDGTLDMSFYPSAAGVTGDYVFSALLQDDGKIVLAGHFRTLNGQPRASLGRLNADGTLDGGFNPAGDYGYKPAIQTDGKIVVGGSGRLNPDGTDDSSFNPPSPNGVVEALVVQAD